MTLENLMSVLVIANAVIAFLIGWVYARNKNKEMEDGIII